MGPKTFYLWSTLLEPYRRGSDVEAPICYRLFRDRMGHMHIYTKDEHRTVDHPFNVVEVSRREGYLRVDIRAYKLNYGKRLWTVTSQGGGGSVVLTERGRNSQSTHYT